VTTNIEKNFINELPESESHTAGDDVTDGTIGDEQLKNMPRVNFS
jgi:hypothetical protein